MTINVASFMKDPDSQLDYSIDWSGWLASGESIIDSEWEVPSGITKEADSYNATTTIIWLSGGTLGEEYTIVNRVTTDNDPERIDDRTIRIRILNR